MSVKVNIYGTEYPVKGDADPEYIQEVAEYLDEKMREVGRSLTVKSSTKVAVLAALNITDELFRTRREKQEEAEALEERLHQLSDRIEERIEA